MPLYPVNFQTLSPQQANPLGYGMTQGAQMAQMLMQARMQNTQNQMLQAQLPYAGQMAQQSLLGKQLANALSKNQVNFAPQMSAADLASKQAMPGLYGSEEQKNTAQAALMGTQNQLYPYQMAANLDPISKMMMGQMLLRRMNGNVGSQGMPSSIASSDGGMTIQPAGGGQSPPVNVPYASPGSYPTLPGGLTAQQGQGVAQALSGAQSNSSPMPGGALPDMSSLYDVQMRNILTSLGKDPAMGTNRGGAGGTFFNPATGQTASTDTIPNATMDQQTSASIQRIQPILQSLSKNLSPFQTATGEGKLRLQQGLNYGLGTQFDLPNQYAQGQADLKTAPESLIRAFGLRVTNEALDRMQAAVEPRFGETATAYQNRITNELNTLKVYQAQANARLKSGMNVDAQPAQPSGMNPSQSMIKNIGGRSYTKINGKWYAQ